MFRLTNPSLIFNEYGRATAKPTDARPGTPHGPAGAMVILYEWAQRLIAAG